jgi:3-phosphoglycerate kinase
MISYLRKARTYSLRGTALLRLDFNTEDEWRVRASLDTVRYLLRHADRVVVMSHRGRPRGVDQKFSLKRDGEKLRKMLGVKVSFINHFRFAEIQREIYSTPTGSVVLLENLRFMPGEESNSRFFAEKLARLGDYYVNDAFAVSHRDDASVDAIAKLLPSYAGFELEREIESLSRVRDNPRRPLVVVLGGGKAHDKLGVIQYFRKKADWFLIGGASGNTVLKLRGVDVGSSKIDAEAHDRPMLRVIAKSKHALTPVDWKKEKGAMLDIGPKTVAMFREKIKSARTILWSGPMGYIEDKRFAVGNLAIAKAIAANKKAFSVTGGGETVAFLKKYKLDNKFGFISTGGGAMVDFLAGKKLPGIEALKKSVQ